VLGFVKAALEVAVLAAVLWLFVFQVSVVSGHSMGPSLEPGDRLVVDKFCYHWRSLRRFDVIVFERPSPAYSDAGQAGQAGAGVDFVKRVVALPRETVEMRRGVLYVDGAMVEQDFSFTDDGSSFGPVAMPEGCVYVLGDNRPRSLDSRTFGTVSLSLMKGVARFRVYPFGRAGSL
jgi:signal peptidase I